MPGRSYELLTKSDLVRLGKIAERDRQDLFRRKPATARLFRDRLFAVALCQGGASHYIDRATGIKDLDVWSFFRANPARPFPYRRRGIADFGDPKFGTTDDRPRFVGRRVDLIGRSIDASSNADPIAVLRDYLHQGKTESARRLAQKSMVLIEPHELLGTVVWRKGVP